MKYYAPFQLFALSLVLCIHCNAAICPDPHTSSLQNGVIPEPWMLNPFSPNQPLRASVFIRANILVAGYGRGVICTYQDSQQRSYSIWWQGNIKIPAPTENAWRSTLGGYECTDALDTCVFYW